MAVFLFALTLFQFALRSLLQDSSLYFFLNPYVLVLPFILIWLGGTIIKARPSDRNLFLAWILLICCPAAMLRTYWGGFDFLMIFIRGMQFFWGPLFLVPGLLGLFRAVNYTDSKGDAARKYLVYTGIFSGSLVLFELIAVYGLRVSPRTFPWVGNSSAGTANIDPFRPWGMASHPQANAVILGYVFWLGYLYQIRSRFQKIISALGTLLSLSGTGQISFFALTPLLLRRPFLGAGIALSPLASLVLYSTATNQFSASSLLQRFDIDYLSFLWDVFLRVAGQFFTGLPANEIAFGTQLPSMDVATGYTHDWAYLDVFLAYGVVGVVGYVLLYAMLAYLSCPSEVGHSKRVYFVLMVLAFNFHYGALNFFVGQMVFSALAALRLNQMFARSLERRHLASAFAVPG